MAKDGEVAFSFQPSVVSSYCLAEVVIETKWPTRCSRPKMRLFYS